MEDTVVDTHCIDTMAGHTAVVFESQWLLSIDELWRLYLLNTDLVVDTRPRHYYNSMSSFDFGPKYSG